MDFLEYLMTKQCLMMIHLGYILKFSMFIGMLLVVMEYSVVSAFPNSQITGGASRNIQRNLPEIIHTSSPGGSDPSCESSFLSDSLISWEKLPVCGDKGPAAASCRQSYDGELNERDAFLSCIWHDPSVRGEECARAYGCKVILPHSKQECFDMAKSLLETRQDKGSLSDLCPHSDKGGNLRGRSAARGLCSHISSVIAQDPDQKDVNDPCNASKNE